MRRSKQIAAAWALLNGALLARCRPDAPLLAVGAVACFPALYVWFDEWIAGTLHLWGMPEIWASDYGQTQSPHAVAFFGFVLSAAMTLWLSWLNA
jgi:hypothetical protein